MSARKKRSEKLQSKLRRLPVSAGVYLFKNGRGQVIYVGKAKVLRNRVRQYFQKAGSLDSKTAALMREVTDLDLIATDNELEALILENSLIKTEKPRYNILLRDDKDWLYLKLTTSEPFPRALLVRRPEKSKDLVYGPFIPAHLARRTKAILHKYLGIRTCNRTITGADPRACLQYDMGRCCAPCISKGVWDEYADNVRKARMLLEGRNTELIAELRESMSEASRKRLYEKAAGFRDAIEIVQQRSEEQRIASTGFEEQDVFAAHIEDDKAVIVLFAVRRGLVRSKKEFSWERLSADDSENLLSTAIQQFYHGISYIPQTVVVQSDFADRTLLEQWLAGARGTKVEIAVPQRGRKRSLLELALENARLAWKNRFTLTEKEALKALQDALALPALPARIECFDISTIQGADQVGTMVSWVNGKPRRSEYRKYKIKTVEGTDDFASMREVVLRRYARLVREGGTLPDLVLIDGGKGQLSAACAALEAAGVGDLPAASLAKKEELVHLPGRKDALRLSRSDPALRLLQQIRDEAHRTAVGYHRDRRGKRTLATALRKVPGIGPARAKKLLIEFGSLERVKKADEAEIAAVIGPKAAKAVREFLERTQ
jgi:excinuclease ABC subunit C